jgi:hypothetical protein
MRVVRDSLKTSTSVSMKVAHKAHMLLVLAAGQIFMCISVQGRRGLRMRSVHSARQDPIQPSPVRFYASTLERDCKTVQVSKR